MTNYTLTQSVRSLLCNAGCDIPKTAEEHLFRYLSLVEEWNEYASLVSRADLARLGARHVPDALSLAPIIKRLDPQGGTLLDIGSGGGFPALPLGILMPELKIFLLERSQKKVAFLRKAAGALGLSGVRVIEGTFPESAQELRPDIVTARAVEEPGKLMNQILAYLPAGASFLCQVPEPKRSIPETFHVEHVEDEWTAQGLRLGSLCIISRPKK